MKSVQKFMIEEGIEGTTELGEYAGIHKSLAGNRRDRGWLIGWCVHDGKDRLCWRNTKGQTIIDVVDI